MIKKRRTPQEKKALSYQKDCRNAYGQSDKGSRKIIPIRKRWVNRTYRRTIKHLLATTPDHPDEELNVEMDIKTQNKKRPFWRKFPDTPLGEFIKHKRPR